MQWSVERTGRICDKKVEIALLLGKSELIVDVWSVLVTFS